MYGLTETIEEMLQLSITDLKRLGMLQPGAYQYTPVNWTRGGRKTASIAVATDTRGEIATVRFVYNCNGSPVDYTAPLRFAPSNLNRGGYYYFVCPVTGRSCRKLYLVGGRFVSRFAFRALYDKQTKSRAERSGLFGYLNAVSDLDRIAQQKGRKMYYRDKITPYGLRVERLAAKVERIGAVYEETERKQQEKRDRRREKLADFSTVWD